MGKVVRGCDTLASQSGVLAADLLMSNFKQYEEICAGNGDRCRLSSFILFNRAQPHIGRLHEILQYDPSFSVEAAFVLVEEFAVTVISPHYKLPILQPTGYRIITPQVWM